MFAPTGNLDLSSLKLAVKSLSLKPQNAHKSVPDADFSETLKSVSMSKDKGADAVSMNSESRQVSAGGNKGPDAVMMNSEGKPVDVKKLVQKLTEKDEASDISQQDMLVMLQQFMLRMQVAGSPQSLTVLKQEESGQVSGQDLLSLPQILKDLQVLIAANDDATRPDMNQLMEDSQAGSSELVAAKPSGFAPVLNNGPAKININDFKMVMNNVKKDLHDIDVKVDAGSKGEKADILFDALPLVSSEDTEVLNENTLFKPDEHKADAATNRENSNLTAMAGSGNHAKEVKNSIAPKETISVARLNEIDVPIMKTLAAGERHLVIRVNPPDLGSVHIKLTMDNGILRADFKVDSNSVKDAFTSSFSQIKTSLENSGFRVGEFHVNVREDDYYPDSQKQRSDGDHQQKQDQNQKQRNEAKSDFFELFA